MANLRSIASNKLRKQNHNLKGLTKPMPSKDDKGEIGVTKRTLVRCLSPMGSYMPSKVWNSIEKPRYSDYWKYTDVEIKR